MSIQPFDDRLHEIITGLLDRTEAKLVSNGTCKAEHAHEYLTTLYIEACAGIIVGGNTYMPNDERIGAEIFLSKLGDAKFNRLSPRRQSACAVHLTNHTHVYFPNFHAMLRLACVHILHSTRGYEEIQKNGVILLASATLPGVRNDVRREFRRRGCDIDRLLVADELYEQRMNRRISYLTTY